MERYEIAARASIPPGYAVVRSGPIRPDDLLFVWPGGGFMRYDSPEWLATVDDAGDALLCIRRAVFDATGFENRRNYKLKSAVTPNVTL